MADVITLSSDSDGDGDDSDVEIVGSYSHVTAGGDPPPLTSVRVDVDAVNVNVDAPTRYIDLTDPRWTFPELKLRKRHNSSALAVVDLTENDIENGTENLPVDDIQIKQESANKSRTLNKQDFNPEKSFSRDSSVFALQQDCCDLKPKHIRLDPPIQQQKQTCDAHHCAPTVKLRRLPFLETHVTELKESKCSVYIVKDSKEMSLHLAQPESNSEAPECIVGASTTSNGPHVEHSFNEPAPNVTQSLLRQELQENSNEFTSTQLNVGISRQSPADSPCSDKGGTVATFKEHSPRENKSDDLCPSVLLTCSRSVYSSEDKAQHVFQREALCSNLEQLELNKADSAHICFHEHSTPDSPVTGLNPSEPTDTDSLSHPGPLKPMGQVDPTPMSEHGQAESTSEWQSEQVRADEASNSSGYLFGSISSDPPLSVSKSGDMDDGSGNGTYRGDLGIDSPLSFLWQEGSDGEQAIEESRFDMDFRAASREDRHYVCPLTLRKIMSGPAQALIDEEDEGLGAPEVLCRQSLSLVYSTIDENYPEGTLQLLSDLLQPGFYPPRDITLHLLCGILLDQQCPYHLCVQAFNLLIRTQRHHMADKTTVPWDWDLLSSVVANQENSKRHRCEVVRMLLEYVVQTLEDDFQAKRSISALHQSIAKATLSCDQQFPHVRDVIKWLFSAIVKSTEPGECKEVARERDEQIRMVSIFQRMLSLALEVDRSPALNSAKLSQELFHMLIGNIPLRAHRMLLLESLQNKLLRCKLLEHLLDYACPLKITVPMSLSLLLHFLKNCTLAPDPMDGTDKWRRWEELVHLLWMLLLSYNKAMKGYLCSSATEQRGKVGTLVYKQDDMVSKAAVREAVEAFLLRSKTDLGQALPLHVEESVTYLQDHLLDVCQC